MKALEIFDNDDNGQGTPRLLCPVPRDGKLQARGEVVFRLYGEEVVHKTVTVSGSCGRVYLPLGWVGKRVKIIRVD